MIKNLILFTSIIMCLSFTKGTNTPSNNGYIKSGENLTFTASYSMSGIMTDIAEVKMITSTIKTKTRELLRLKCTASTYTNWDSFFKVRDLYESYVDPISLKPSLYKRSIEEGTYKKELKYLFKRKSGIAVSTLNKKGYKDYKVDVPIDSKTLDIVSSIYNARILDYESMPKGATTVLDVIVDSEVQTVSIKYLGKESVQVAKDGKKECYKLSLAFGGKEIEDIKGGKYIWITADNDRLPALIKADIPVGSIQIKLSNYTK